MFRSHFVTILSVSFNKDTNNVPVITQKMRGKTIQNCYWLNPVM